MTSPTARTSTPLRHAIAVALATAAPWMSACAGDASGPPAPRSVHVDSAGVDLVIDSTPRARVPVFATFDSAPTLRLGALDARAEEQFGSVADVLPLPDGGVAVLDGQAAVIRVFGPDGAYRNTLGSKGDGPGELRDPTALGPLGADSIEVFDRRTTRVTRFSIDGGIGDITTLRFGGRVSAASAMFFEDGRLAGQSRWFAEQDGNTPPPPSGQYTFVLDSAVIATYASDGAVQDTMEVLPNRETVRLLEFGDQMISVWVWPAVFGRTTHFQPHPDGLWAGFNDHFALRLHDATDGRLVRVIRAPGLDRPVTEEAAQNIRDYTLARDEDQQPRQRRDIQKWFEVSPRPEWMPAYDRIVVDDQARLWVRDWSGTEPSRRWWVFARTGELLGSVDVPVGAPTIYAVRCGVAWAVAKDELDVSYVVRYLIHAPGADLEAGCGADGK